jgi:hypothetical protein
MNWLRTVLLVVALAHLSFGLYGLYAPNQMAQVADLEMRSIGAVGEIRGIYGGLMVAFGLAVLRGSMGGRVAAAWLRVIALGYAGIVLGRLASLALDGLSGYTIFAGAFELVLAAFLGWSATEVARMGVASGTVPAGAVASSDGAEAMDDSE